MEVLSAPDVIPLITIAQTTNHQASTFYAYHPNGLAESEKPYFLIPHRKDYYLFVLVKQGRNRHWVDMVPYQLKPDTFYYTIPHQVHLKESIEAMQGTALLFNDEFLALGGNHELKQLPIIQNLHKGHELFLNEADLLFIEDLLNKTVKEYESHDDWKNGMMHAYLRILLIYLSRIYTAQFENNASITDQTLLRRFQALVEAHYEQRHEVSSYAELLNISAGHLSEVIKQQSGKTAIEHIHDRLMLEAKRLLFHTEISIKELAYRLNFSDVSYFVRFFKRLTGQPPASYRTEFRKMYHSNL